MGHAHLLHEAPLREGAQGREGLRQRPQEPGQEHHPHSLDDLLREGAMGEAMAVEGSTKAFVFEAYLERFLAPTLEEGQRSW